MLGENPVVSKNTNELKLGAPPTFSASLTQTPTIQELASVRRFLDGLCSGNNNDSASAERPNQHKNGPYSLFFAVIHGCQLRPDSSELHHPPPSLPNCGTAETG